MGMKRGERRRRFDPSWSGSDDWIEATRVELLRHRTRAETLVIDLLGGRGTPFRRQEVVARRFFVTLVLPGSGVALEFVPREPVNRSAYNAERDRHREEAIARAGWRLVRLTEEGVLADIRSIDLRIAEAVGLAVPGDPVRSGLAEDRSA